MDLSGCSIGCHHIFPEWTIEPSLFFSENNRIFCGDETECYILCILFSVYDGMPLSNSELKKPFSYDKWLLVDCNSHSCQGLPHLIYLFSTTIHYSSSQIYLNMKSWLLRYLKYFDDIYLSQTDQFYASNSLRSYLLRSRNIPHCASKFLKHKCQRINYLHESLLF